MKLLYVINIDWFFISHRLPIALKALESGIEVHLACGITDKKDYLESVGIKVHPLPLSRSGTGIFTELIALKELWYIVKRISPDVCHMVTIKGVIYGGFVTRLLKVGKRVASISGLGYVFIDESIKSKVLRRIVKTLYRFGLSTDTKVIFQNKSDESIFVNSKLIKQAQCIQIRGSGVDLNKFNYTPEPKEDKKIVMFLARLLKDKGLFEFCRAAEMIKIDNEVRFVLVGDIDLCNPNSITQDELAKFVNDGVVEHWGFSSKVDAIIPQSHIMVLPSYREGLPKSLLEAAACGRAVITTDAPGCRDAITPNVTGLLVKPKNPSELASAIITLVKNDLLRNEFGKAGRKLAEECFDVNDVIAQHLSIYNT